MSNGKKYNYSYQPGRSVDELERERFEERMRSTPEERFRKMVKLIRLSYKTKAAAKKAFFQ